MHSEALVLQAHFNTLPPLPPSTYSQLGFQSSISKYHRDHHIPNDVKRSFVSDSESVNCSHENPVFVQSAWQLSPLAPILHSRTPATVTGVKRPLLYLPAAQSVHVVAPVAV